MFTAVFAYSCSLMCGTLCGPVADLPTVLVAVVQANMSRLVCVLKGAQLYNAHFNLDDGQESREPLTVNRIVLLLSVADRHQEVEEMEATKLSGRHHTTHTTIYMADQVVAMIKMQDSTMRNENQKEIKR